MAFQGGFRLNAKNSRPNFGNAIAALIPNVSKQCAIVSEPVNAPLNVHLPPDGGASRSKGGIFKPL